MTASPAADGYITRGRHGFPFQIVLNFELTKRAEHRFPSSGPGSRKVHFSTNKRSQDFGFGGCLLIGLACFTVASTTNPVRIGQCFVLGTHFKQPAKKTICMKVKDALCWGAPAFIDKIATEVEALCTFNRGHAPPGVVSATECEETYNVIDTRRKEKQRPSEEEQQSPKEKKSPPQDFKVAGESIPPFY